MKRILVLVPVTTSQWNAPLLEEMERCKRPDTHLDIINLSKGPVSIDDWFDATWAALHVVQAAMKAEADGYDGMIVYCYDDPGVRAAKEAVRMPVVGLGEASAHIASLISHKFGIVTAGLPQKTAAVIWDNLRMIELDHKCVGVKPVGIPVLRLTEDHDEQERNLTEYAQELAAKGAEVIVLGCGSMLGVADPVSKKLGIPIVIPARAALALVESLAAMGLAQSKRGFGTPTEKSRTC